MRQLFATLALLTLGAPAAAGGPSDGGQPTRSKMLRSKAYTIDRIYRSMKGPGANRNLVLGEAGQPELLWVVGYRTEIVDAQGNPASPGFMCHANLRISDAKRHREIFGLKKAPFRRLFTLSQGQMETRFPSGFGIPVLSDEPLEVTTMVLNLNPLEQPIEVRHETTVEYVRDRDLAVPMKPLFTRAAQSLVLVKGDEPYFGVAEPDPALHGPGCAVGTPAGKRTQSDSLGREFAAHWVVEPGHETNRTLVTEGLNLPYDTTAHHIAVHLHPFAESLELRDLTTDQTVYESRARNTPDRIGLDHVDSFSSAEGIPLYKDHEYELVSRYNNTTSEDQDSMAVMYLYLLDQEIRKPGA
jgi:hypothetical protein